MTDINKVSVIIVNWNGEQFLERCLTAIMAQTIKPHEIILVDNASSDGSLAIVRQFSKVQLIQLDQNTGFARGNNLATHSVSHESEWIALINPDVFLEPCWLETLLTAAKNNSEFDMFASKLISAFNPNIMDGAGDSYHISGRVWRRRHNSPVIQENVREIFSPCAAAALYRRNIFNEVGGFDEEYFCYVEDVDLGFRLRLAGYRCLYVPQSVAHHVGSGTTGGQHSNFSVYHGHRNLVWTYVKNMPGVLLWILLPIHLLLNLASVAYFIKKGQKEVIVAAKWDAIKGIPKMWQKRLKIQSVRKVSVATIWHLLDKNLWITKKY